MSADKERSRGEAPLSGLARGWRSIELPGYREHPSAATYSVFDYGRLPPLDREFDDRLVFLTSRPAVENSLATMGTDDPVPWRPATGAQLTGITAGLDIRLPGSFEAFIESPEPRSRVRSCTACYLDLADFAVPVEGGGWLIHFLSDQQWTAHWLLYADSEGTEAVVSTTTPYGFALDHDAPSSSADTTHRFTAGNRDAVRCADSFAEFLYRFWIENEIWFAITQHRSLPPQHRRYAEHYLS